MSRGPGSPVLEAVGLASGYRGVPVLRDVDLEVRAGEVVALLGPNGSGKTTLLLTLVGELPVTGGEVRWDGRPSRDSLNRKARQGLSFVGEDRSVFMRLTLRENLRVGRVDVESAMELFPELKPRLRVPVGQLSGGEQQMLTLARALARQPRALLVDELSLGLAPLLVARLMTTLREVATERKLAVLIVEQQVNRVMKIADYLYVLAKGQVADSGTPSEMNSSAMRIRDAYLGRSAFPEADPEQETM
jgi:branched-chain amino acid transport system ATP-binding protein